MRSPSTRGVLAGSAKAGEEALAQQRAIADKRVHQAAVVVRFTAAPALAVHVRSKGDIAEAGHALGDLVHAAVDAAPVVKNEDARSLAAQAHVRLDDIPLKEFTAVEVLKYSAIAGRHGCSAADATIGRQSISHRDAGGPSKGVSKPPMSFAAGRRCRRRPADRVSQHEARLSTAGRGAAEISDRAASFHATAWIAGASACSRG
jgi:hypothetical protein